MEYFDILDEQGSPTGEQKERSQVHADGDWHKSVDIWVVDKASQKILIQKRAHDKDSYPSLWEVSASGHVGAGEDSMTAVLRELEEELGLKAQPEDFQFMFAAKERHVTNNGTFLNNELKDVFLLEGDFQLQDIEILEKEIAEVRFISLDELETLVKYHRDQFVPHEELYVRSFEFFRVRFE